MSALRVAATTVASLCAGIVATRCFMSSNISTPRLDASVLWLLGLFSNGHEVNIDRAYDLGIILIFLTFTTTAAFAGYWIQRLVCLWARQPAKSS